MCLSCGIKPNIIFVVDYFSRENANPKISYLKAAKQVIRYLKGIIYLGTIYKTGTNEKNNHFID